MLLPASSPRQERIPHGALSQAEFLVRLAAKPPRSSAGLFAAPAAGAVAPGERRRPRPPAAGAVDEEVPQEVRGFSGAAGRAERRDDDRKARGERCSSYPRAHFTHVFRIFPDRLGLGIV